LKSYLVTIGKALEKSGWLVGNSMTVADLVLANVLVFNF
jgi:glutathione S-transferase